VLKKWTPPKNRGVAIPPIFGKFEKNQQNLLKFGQNSVLDVKETGKLVKI
jgi:hypothetical protein